MRLEVYCDNKCTKLRLIKLDWVRDSLFYLMIVLRVFLWLTLSCLCVCVWRWSHDLLRGSRREFRWSCWCL